ncbi:hypothetical protein [Gloeobacter kilaueensis]|uniref:6-carboxytetrahydropterin synthase n=1 Tax=Gloeobacter kilaueensis (strain ATCC BAA-2537 / CCAP 1431/1 / ULC 316 / JS1) TaxID=1183438 RepID=U5QCJ4_GLOK1|nr:hypothetical protein [Gloeobacter kilaueensis]AGY56563.1 hypothetical protein GKIL_0316 [Gloeobacter kilaueensis JS1]
MEAPYLTVVAPDRQVYPGTIRYEYRIAAGFRRRHANPPLWHDRHEHEFTVTLELAAFRPPTGLYGLDMVALEEQLKRWTAAIPPVLNDCPLCPHGTTEELCHYFASLPLESHVQLLAVSVAESPERVTILRLAHPDR